MKIAPALLALVLLLGACSSDSDDDATTAAETTESTDATDATDATDDTTATSTEEAGATDGDDDAETTTDDGTIAGEDDPAGDDPPISEEPQFEDSLESLGLDGTDEELLACFEDEGIDTDAAVDAIDELALIAATLQCAPETLSDAVAGGTIIDGLTDDDVLCVSRSVIDVLAGLDEDDLAVAMAADDVPDDIRAEVLDQAPSECGLTEDQVDSVLDS